MFNKYIINKPVGKLGDHFLYSSYPGDLEQQVKKIREKKNLSWPLDSFEETGLYVVTTIVAGPQGYVNGDLISAKVYQPTDVFADMEGNIWVSDNYNHRTRRIRNGVMETIGGNGKIGFRDGKGEESQMYYPLHMAEDNKYIYLTEWGNCTIRKIDKVTLEISTVAGNPSHKNHCDGSLEKAMFNTPKGIVVDAEGDLLICDSKNKCIRKICMKEKVVKTIAGKIFLNGFKDGDALDALFSEPCGSSLDLAGNLVIADAYNHCIRKFIISENRVVTIAGVPGVKGKEDSPIPLKATFYNPWDLEIDKVNGDIYVADTGNYLIRKITSNGVETLRLAELAPGAQPSFISLDMEGNLIISENRLSSINVILNIGSRYIKLTKITMDMQEILTSNIFSLDGDRRTILISNSTFSLHYSICSARCASVLHLRKLTPA